MTDDQEFRRELAIERLSGDVNEAICFAMENRHINRAALAEKLGVTRSAITQRLQGRTSISLARLATLLDVMDFGLEVALVDREDSNHVIRIRNYEVEGQQSNVLTMPARVWCGEHAADEAEAEGPVYAWN